MPPAGVEDTSQIANANADLNTRVVDVDIVRVVPIWRDTECKTGYSGVLDGQRFGAMFINGANSFMFDRHSILRDREIGA